MTFRLRWLTFALLSCATAEVGAQEDHARPLTSPPGSLLAGHCLDIQGHLFAPCDAGAATDRRSPVVAGALSVSLAGLGSFYADNSMHGIRHIAVLSVTAAGAFLTKKKNIDPTSLNYITGGCESACLAFLAANAANWIWSVVVGVSDANAYNLQGRLSEERRDNDIGTGVFRQGSPSVFTARIVTLFF